MPYLYNEYFTPSYHCVLDLSHSFHRYIFADKTFFMTAEGSQRNDGKTLTHKDLEFRVEDQQTQDS